MEFPKLRGQRSCQAGASSRYRRPHRSPQHQLPATGPWVHPLFRAKNAIGCMRIAKQDLVLASLRASVSESRAVSFDRRITWRAPRPRTCLRCGTDVQLPVQNDTSINARSMKDWAPLSALQSAYWRGHPAHRYLDRSSRNVPRRNVRLAAMRDMRVIHRLPAIFSSKSSILSPMTCPRGHACRIPRTAYFPMHGIDRQVTSRSNQADDLEPA